MVCCHEKLKGFFLVACSVVLGVAMLCCNRVARVLASPPRALHTDGLTHALAAATPTDKSITLPRSVLNIMDDCLVSRVPLDDARDALVANERQTQDANTNALRSPVWPLLPNRIQVAPPPCVCRG